MMQSRTDLSSLLIDNTYTVASRSKDKMTLQLINSDENMVIKLKVSIRFSMEEMSQIGNT